jgi:hypothetical protein
MRFVLGIIAGALVTLFIATAMDAPTERIVDQIVSTGMEHWRADTHLETPALTQTTEQAGATEPVLTLPAPMVTEPVPDTRQLPVPDTPETAQEHASIALAESARALPIPLLEEVANVHPPADTSGDVQQVVVWAPFHSEASARGFATRLTNQLAHPFKVEKTGPANYLVTYKYRDEPNRVELEQQIAYVTGAATP